jgi:hypothetical protein
MKQRAPVPPRGNFTANVKNGVKKEKERFKKKGRGRGGERG